MRIPTVPALTALLLALAACNTGGNVNPPPPETVTLTVKVTPDNDVIDVGGTRDFNATVTASSGTVATALKWSSSDPSVATVDDNGVAHGLKAGSATITATASPTGTASNAPKPASGSATLVVAVPVTGAVEVLGHSVAKATAGGSERWFGGGPIVLRAPATVDGKDVDSIEVTFPEGLTPGGTQVLDRTGLKLLPEDNKVTMKDATFTVTKIHFADGSAAPGDANSVTTINIDDEPPAPMWAGTPQYSGDCATFSPYPANDPRYPAPGTHLSWDYTLSDTGVGLARAEHYVYYNREFRDNAKPDPDGVSTWFEEPLDPGHDFTGLPASGSGTISFVTMGGGKTHTVVGFDGLGNASSFQGMMGTVCNDYAENGLGHTMTEIDLATTFGENGITAVVNGSTVTFTAHDVVASPPDGYGCSGCPTQPDYTATLDYFNFFTRPPGSNVYRFAGRLDITPPEHGPITRSLEVNLPNEQSGTYDIAVSVVNNYSMQDIARNLNGYTR